MGEWRTGYLGLGFNVGDPAPRHSPRPLDIDLLLLGDLEFSADRLTLPHREVTIGRFVLVALLELEPELVLPDGTKLVATLLYKPECP